MSTTHWTTCITIKRRDGVVIGLTELDRDLEIDGVTYRSAAGYTPSTYSQTDSLSVDHADVEGLLGAVGIQREDIKAGLYDDAELTLFVYDWQAHVVVRRIAHGHWGQCTLLNGRYVAEFRSLSQKLQQTVGRIYTPGCDAELGDARCKVNKSALSVTGTVTAASSGITVQTSRTEPDGHWRGGLLRFTGGANAGREYEVRMSHADGRLILFLPLVYPASAGDGYVLEPGCDKTLEMCRDRYNNVLNFRGFPHLPGTIEIMRFGKRP